MVYRRRRKSGGLSKVNRVLEPDRPGEGERDGQRRVPARASYHARHGLVHEDRVGASHRRLSVFERVPGEAEARLKILVVLMIDLVDSVPDAHQRGGLRVKDDKAVVALARASYSSRSASPSSRVRFGRHL